MHDADLPTVLFQREKLVTTRKPHACLACSVVIPANVKAYYIIVMTDWDDKPYYGYLHGACKWGY